MAGDSLILKPLVPLASGEPTFLVWSRFTFALMSVSKGDGAGTGGALPTGWGHGGAGLALPTTFHNPATLVLVGE